MNRRRDRDVLVAGAVDAAGIGLVGSAIVAVAGDLLPVVST